MNTSKENCAFCDQADIGWRTITAHELFTSFVSNPRFREGQCLVIPNRHIMRTNQLNDDESRLIMTELGRLSVKLDTGFGTGIMQKYQPLQPENEIKVNHLHFHVFPRLEEEHGLFPTPEPNDFSGFGPAPRDEITALAESLR